MRGPRRNRLPGTRRLGPRAESVVIYPCVSARRGPQTAPGAAEPGRGGRDRVNETKMKSAIRIDAGEIALVDLVAVALRGARVELSGDLAWRARIQASRDVLEAALRDGRSVYGVSTQVGNSSAHPIDPARQVDHALSVMRQHGCGVGEPFSEIQCRAVMLARLVNLAKGYSGVRVDLLERLGAMLNHRIAPVIPRIGSVGASGDLTPLSYLAAAMAGEREAYFEGKIVPAHEALAAVGLEPFTFAPKETLAIMNGTSVMTGLGILCLHRFAGLIGFAEKATALAVEILRGRSHAFHPTVHEAKPHPGQMRAAHAIRTALAGSRLLDPPDEPGRPIQDRYSTRCAPQALGAVWDALEWGRNLLRVELNGVNDNPLVDPDTGEILFAGNFFGGHIALTMDTLKLGAASVADMVDRQFALLVDESSNMNLPETLVPYGGGGVKGLQITCSALTALINQRAAPDSILSRPTECLNQDKVSMGLNAAVNAGTALDLLGQAIATHLIALSNAARFRDEEEISPKGRELTAFVREHSPVLTEDRRLDLDIAGLAAALEDGSEPS